MATFERSPSTNPNTPLVVILGFGGSKSKHLLKYSNIYQNRGYETAIFVSPILTIRKFNDLLPYAEELYSRANFDKEGHRFIIFHIMSTIGITTFSCFGTSFQNKPNGQILKSQIVGIVFDSGPIRIATPRCAASAVSVAKYPIKFKDVYSQVMRISVYFFLFAYYSYLKLLTIVSVDKKNEICTFYRMENMDDLPLNQLYLYSKADSVIDYRQVEEFIKNQQRRVGSRVEVKRWSDSMHVKHVLKHPKEYTRLCTEFADRLFNMNRSKL